MFFEKFVANAFSLPRFSAMPSTAQSSALALLANRNSLLVRCGHQLLNCLTQLSGLLGATEFSEKMEIEGRWKKIQIYTILPLHYTRIIPNTYKFSLCTNDIPLHPPNSHSRVAIAQQSKSDEVQVYEKYLLRLEKSCLLNGFSHPRCCCCFLEIFSSCLCV